MRRHHACTRVLAQLMRRQQPAAVQIFVRWRAAGRSERLCCQQQPVNSACSSSSRLQCKQTSSANHWLLHARLATRLLHTWRRFATRVSAACIPLCLCVSLSLSLFSSVCMCASVLADVLGQLTANITIVVRTNTSSCIVEKQNTGLIHHLLSATVSPFHPTVLCCCCCWFYTKTT